ncbi:MAG TPA: type II toxin-antitoxin system VapC family toxin [Rhizomicrobium sp.]|nr:type II toxin-antitoxin system VapC family toxin [Rhizomicrobium sp.]
MRLLLDSNIVVPLTRKETHGLGAKFNLLLNASTNEIFVSVASLWEIAIKTRLGKLDPGIPLADIPAYFASGGFMVIAVEATHATEDLAIQPNTRDPFDRLLLAQCQVENMRLVTTDRALASHPLVWREP